MEHSSVSTARYNKPAFSLRPVVEDTARLHKLVVSERPRFSDAGVVAPSHRVERMRASTRVTDTPRIAEQRDGLSCQQRNMHDCVTRSSPSRQAIPARSLFSTTMKSHQKRSRVLALLTPDTMKSVKEAKVDKAEAEGVAAAIRRETWIVALAVELNPVTNTYEVKCRDLERRIFIFVKSSRDWDMLKQRHS